MLGWVIDTSYRSLVEKKYAPGTWLPFIAPIYGFGGLALFSTTANLNLPSWIEILAIWIIFIKIELIGGIFCEKVIGRKLWDYSKNKFNFKGHIDLIHSIYWLILAVAGHSIITYLLI